MASRTTLVAALAGGCALAACSERVPDPVAPTTVLLAADPVAHESVDYEVRLSWAPAGLYDGFLVEVAGDDGPFTSVGRVHAGVRSAVVNLGDQVPDATLLTFRVRSTGNGKVSRDGPTASIQHPIRSPGHATVVRVGVGLRVAWTPGARVAEAVRLDRTLVTHGGSETTLAPLLLAGDAREVLDADVGAWSDGARIRYEIVNMRRGLESPRSAPAVSPAAGPTAPAAVTFASSGRNVRVGWENTSASATSIEVFRALFPGGGEELMATLPPDATSFEQAVEDEAPYVYRVMAASPTGRADASVAGAVATQPLLERFTVRVVGLPDAEAVSGSPLDGWVALGRVPHAADPTLHLPAEAGWSTRPFTWHGVNAVALRGSLAAGAYASGDGELRLATVRRSDSGWLDGDDVALPGEDWNSAAGVDVSGDEIAFAGNSYVSSRGGWVRESLPCGGLDPRTLRLDAGGEPLLLATRAMTRPPVLASRAGGVWTCSPIPGLSTLAEAYALAPTAGGLLVVVSDHVEGARSLFTVERDAEGWHPPQPVAIAGTGWDDFRVHVSPQGRVALLEVGTTYDTSRLHVREAGATIWASYALMPRSSAIAGFGPDGKLWVLDGLAQRASWPFDGVRPYALFEER